MNQSNYLIGSSILSIKTLRDIRDQGLKLALSEEAKSKISASRAFLNRKVEQSVDPIYGINTGFGSLCDTEVSKEDLGILQRNLVTSHACGMGEEVPAKIVKLMLLLKVQGLSQGHSGVQLETVERLIAMYNEEALPVVYQLGSLGASGDLAPLAHLSLPLLGLGELRYQGQLLSGQQWNEEMKLKAIALQSKEGLALLNGTQFMSAYACHLILQLQDLSAWADFNAAASLDAFDGRPEPFNHLVHDVRPHPGQMETAERILHHLEGSELIKQKKKHVQDPYCFRCAPQVHGASKDTLAHAQRVVEVEINSVTDNPTLFERDDLVVSAGNFHGQPLALVLDFLAIAAAEWASISERRLYKLVSGTRGLPAFLTPKPGLNSGFMIVQYAAASAVSQNKQLASPASVDTIDSSNGQEDHVSMGANAATKLYRIVQNLERVLGAEWMGACQGLDLRETKSSPSIQAMKKAYREEVHFIENDQVMYTWMENSRKFIRENKIPV